MGLVGSCGGGNGWRGGAVHSVRGDGSPSSISQSLKHLDFILCFVGLICTRQVFSRSRATPCELNASVADQTTRCYQECSRLENRRKSKTPCPEVPICSSTSWTLCSMQVHRYVAPVLKFSVRSYARPAPTPLAPRRKQEGCLSVSRSSVLWLFLLSCSACCFIDSAS